MVDPFELLKVTTQTKGSRAELLQQAIRLKRAAARSKASRPGRSGGAPMAPRPVDADAPLGELQRSLWLQHQLEPSSPAYNLTSAYRVSGDLGVPDLERSLIGVVARHRLLRSTFRSQTGRILQVVHAEPSIEGQQVSVEQLTVGSGEALATAIREARKPFDLEVGPLIRLLLIEESSESEPLLVLVMHHILADERSLGFLWQELAEIYNGRQVEAPDQPQHDDYVHWRAEQAPQSRVTQLAYWRRQLDPLPDDLILPFEREADPKCNGDEPSARGRLLSRPLGLEVSRQIRRVAAATDTTPFIVLAFVFRLLLHRLTEGRKVAFATPATQRSHPATARMIGYFLNPVVICALIEEGRSVEQAIREFSRQMRDSLAHASLPFDVLVGELSPARQRDRHPIFQTMFVYQETPPPPDMEGVGLEPITLDLGESKFDLTLFASEHRVAEGAYTLEIAVEYRVDRFDEVWMGNLLGHYETLVRQLAADLGRATAEVPWLRPAETETLRRFAQGSPASLALPDAAGATVPAEPANPALLPQQILNQARRRPQAMAVSSSDAECSYTELESSACRIARELLRQGVQRGDRVGLFVDRSSLMISGLLASHWVGAAYVPLDPAYPSARNLDVLEDAEVTVVLTRSGLLDRLPEAAPPTIDLDALEGGGPAGNDAEGAGFGDGDAEPLAMSDLCAEDPAYILYTSGSTGRPKGVVITHGNLGASNGARLRFYEAPPKRFLLLSSIAFDSSVAGLFWTLATGGALILPTDDEARDPRRLVQLIFEKQVTSLLCVPSLYAHMLDAGKDQHLLRGLETVIVAGESCQPQLVEEHFRLLPQTRLFNEYGPTEATVWATVHEIERPQSGRPCRGAIPIGRPIPGVRVEVLDERGRRVPAEIPGQGWISGPTVAQGYWRRRELTAERFVQHKGADLGVDREARWYRTGDRLSWTPDGQLLFLGRVDEQIKHRGFRIAPGEIEAALLEVFGFEEAAVVVRSRSQLVAFIETNGGIASGWREELGKRLPDFMVPNRLVELPELPRLPNGKVDRRRLREMTLPAQPGGAEASDDKAFQVLDDGEQSLVSLWEGLLGRVGIGPTDNFFQLGGHSLLVVEMTSAIERDFGVVLAPAEVFQHPTIRELGRRIEQRGGPDTPTPAHLFPIQSGGHRTPLVFSVPHFFSEMLATRFRGERPVYGLRGVSLRPEGNRGRWPTLRDLGEELVEEICRRFPDQAVIMMGYSFGATMAVEAVRLMEERGIPVQGLYLIAPMPVDFFRFGPFRVQLDGLRHPVTELSLSQVLLRLARENHPFRRRLYQRAQRLLVTQPWRRLLCWIGRLRTRVGLPLTSQILHADVRLERFRLHAGYRPGVVYTPTVMFNAREPETDAAATWRPFFKGPFTVHETPDPHLGEASVRAAKTLILQHLQELDTDPEAGKT